MSHNNRTMEQTDNNEEEDILKSGATTGVDCFEAFKELTQGIGDDETSQKESETDEYSLLDQPLHPTEGNVVETDSNQKQEQEEVRGLGQFMELYERGQKHVAPTEEVASTSTSTTDTFASRIRATPILPKNLLIVNQLPAAAVSPVVFQVDRTYVKQCCTEMSAALGGKWGSNVATTENLERFPFVSKKAKIKHPQFFFVLPLRLDLSDQDVLECFKRTGNSCSLQCITSTNKSVVLQQRVRVTKAWEAEYNARIEQQTEATGSDKRYYPVIAATEDSACSNNTWRKWGYSEFVKALSLSIGFDEDGGRICLMNACQFPLPPTEHPESYGQLVDRTSRNTASSDNDLEGVFGDTVGSTECALMAAQKNRDTKMNQWLLPWMLLRFTMDNCECDGAKLSSASKSEMIPPYYASANESCWVIHSTFKSEHVHDELLSTVLNFTNGLRCQKANPLVEGHWEALVEESEAHYKAGMDTLYEQGRKLTEVSPCVVKGLYQCIYSRKYLEIEQEAMNLENIGRFHEKKMMQIAFALKKTFEQTKLEFPTPKIQTNLKDITLKYTAPPSESFVTSACKDEGCHIENQSRYDTEENLNSAQQALRAIHAEAFSMYTAVAKTLSKTRDEISKEIDEEMKARLHRKKVHTVKREIESFNSSRGLVEILVRKTTHLARTVHDIDYARTLDEVFGLRNDTLLLGTTANYSGKSGKLILTEAHLCFCSKLFGFSTVWSMPWEDVLSVNIGEESLISNAPLKLSWLDTNDANGEHPCPDDPVFDNLDPQRKITLLSNSANSWSVKTASITPSQTSSEIIHTVILFLRQLATNTGKSIFCEEIIGRNVIDPSSVDLPAISSGSASNTKRYDSSRQSKPESSPQAVSELDDLFNMPTTETTVQKEEDDVPTMESLMDI